jgi:hypothetical protein
MNNNLFKLEILFILLFIIATSALAQGNSCQIGSGEDLDTFSNCDNVFSEDPQQMQKTITAIENQYRISIEAINGPVSLVNGILKSEKHSLNLENHRGSIIEVTKAGEIIVKTPKNEHENDPNVQVSSVISVPSGESFKIKIEEGNQPATISDNPQITIFKGVVEIKDEGIMLHEYSELTYSQVGVISDFSSVLICRVETCSGNFVQFNPIALKAEGSGFFLRFYHNNAYFVVNDNANELSNRYRFENDYLKIRVGNDETGGKLTVISDSSSSMSKVFTQGYIRIENDEYIISYQDEKARLELFDDKKSQALRIGNERDRLIREVKKPELEENKKEEIWKKIDEFFLGLRGPVPLTVFPSISQQHYSFGNEFSFRVGQRDEYEKADNLRTQLYDKYGMTFDGFFTTPELLSISNSLSNFDQKENIDFKKIIYSKDDKIYPLFLKEGDPRWRQSITNAYVYTDDPTLIVWDPYVREKSLTTRLQFSNWAVRSIAPTAGQELEHIFRHEFGHVVSGLNEINNLNSPNEKDLNKISPKVLFHGQINIPNTDINSLVSPSGYGRASIGELQAEIMSLRLENPTTRDRWLNGDDILWLKNKDSAQFNNIIMQRIQAYNLVGEMLQPYKKDTN